MSAMDKGSLVRAIGISTSVLVALILSGCAHDELEQAKDSAAEANLRAAQAEHAASLSQKSAQDANFARFEAESRADQAERERKAAEAHARIIEESRLSPLGGYEHYEYSPGNGSYTESYESYEKSW